MELNGNKFNINLTNEEIDKILLDFIKANNLLELFDKLEVSDFYELIESQDELVDDYDATWSGGKDGNEPIPKKTVTHYTYKVTRNYHFRTNGLQFGINIPLGNIEKETKLDGKRLQVDENIYIALEKDMKKSERLIPFICNIFDIKIDDVINKAIKNSKELEYQQLNEDLTNVRKQMDELFEEITNCKILIDKNIKKQENYTKYNSNNSIIKVENLDKLVIKYIKAHNLLDNFEKVKLTDSYNYVSSRISDDYNAREAIKIGLTPDEYYIYDNKRIYEFNINGFWYKIEIPQDKVETTYQIKEDKEKIDDPYKLLSMLEQDNNKNSYLMALLIAVLNIDIEKIVNTPDAEDIYDEMIDIQVKLKKLNEKYSDLSKKREQILEKYSEVLDYFISVEDVEDKSIKSK